jgi:hypothetical protein
MSALNSPEMTGLVRPATATATASVLAPAALAAAPHLWHAWRGRSRRPRQ